MIKLGVQTGGAEKYLGIDGAYRLFKEIGFDAVDASICNTFPYEFIRRREIPSAFCGSEQDLLDAVRPWKDAAEKYDLPNFQAHAPYPNYVFDEQGDYNDKLGDMLQKMIRACDYIGCRNLVVHPFFLEYRHQLDPAFEWENNMERYASLIPAAKEYGITICLENMFMEYRGKIYGACCSDITKACAYVDALNALAGCRQFGFCLDTGHLLLCGKDVRFAMDELDERICAFHVHDNNGIEDEHLSPEMGILDWDRFTQGLRDIRYDSTVCFEIHKLWSRFSFGQMPEILRNLLKTGQKITSI